jgi:hypothetical protein
VTQPFTAQNLYRLWRSYMEGPTEKRQQELWEAVAAVGYGVFHVQADGGQWRLQVSGTPPLLTVSSER